MAGAQIVDPVSFTRAAWSLTLVVGCVAHDIVVALAPAATAAVPTAEGCGARGSGNRLATRRRSRLPDILVGVGVIRNRTARQLTLGSGQHGRSALWELGGYNSI